MGDTDILNSAWESVSSSDIPDDLKGMALKELLRARLGSTTYVPATAPVIGAPPGRGAPPPPTGGASVDTDAAYRKLAHETGIDEDKIREVILFEPSGEVHLLQAGRQLGSNNAEKTRNVVSLIAGARHGAFNERSVNIELVRAECQEKKCYDQANFKSGHVGKHDGVTVRGDELYVNPSKWLGMFEKALATARGAGES